VGFVSTAFTGAGFAAASFTVADAGFTVTAGFAAAAFTVEAVTATGEGLKGTDFTCTGFAATAALVRTLN
jgi:hypothetical protein